MMTISDRDEITVNIQDINAFFPSVTLRDCHI